MILKDLIKSAQKVTVQDDGEEYAINRCFADPPILLNSGINIFSFPKYFLSLHKVLSVLYSQNLAFSTLHDSFSGSMNSVFQPIPNYLPPGPGNIIETAQMLPPLFEELDQEGVDLLLVFLKPQFENPDTKLAAFKHLFHPVGQALGRQKAIKTFFKGLQALYDNIDINDVEEAQILDQDYLSKIITVFGLDCFLVQFSPFVLEVLVGGLQSLPQKTTKPDENSLGQQSEEGEFSNENMAETRKVSEENPDQDLSCEDNVDKQNTRKLRDALQLDFEESLSPKVGAIDADTPWKTGIDMAKLAAAFDTIHESFEDDLWRESSFNSSYEANSQGSDAMTGALALEPKIVNTTTDIPVRDDLNLLHEDNLQSVEIPSVLENKNNVDFLQSDPQNSAFVNKVKGFDDGLPDKSSVIDTNSNNDLFLNGGKLNGSNILLDTDNIGESDEVPSEVSNKEPDFHPLTQQTEDACNGSQALLEHSDDEQEHDMESKAERPNNSGSTEEIFNGTADDNTGFVDERMTDFDNAGGSTSQLSDKLTPNNRTEGAANSSVTELVDFVSDHQSYLQLPRPSSDYGDRAFRTDSQESPYIILDGNEGDVSRVEVPDDVIDLTIDNINPPVSKRDSFTKRRYSYQSDSSVFEVNPQQLALTSLKWIIPWLGPILTSKYVVKPILKRLPRLFQLLRNKDADQDCIQNETAGKLRNIMDCLVEVVMVYGEEIIFGYFIPYAIKAVSKF